MEDNNSRRRFLVWGAGAAGAITFLSGLNFLKPFSKKSEMKKMLTQDGTLVEIDAALLKKTNKKATNKDLQQWIKR